MYRVYWQRREINLLRSGGQHQQPLFAGDNQPHIRASTVRAASDAVPLNPGHGEWCEHTDEERTHQRWSRLALGITNNVACLSADTIPQRTSHNTRRRARGLEAFSLHPRFAVDLLCRRPFRPCKGT